MQVPLICLFFITYFLGIVHGDFLLVLFNVSEAGGVGTGLVSIDEKTNQATYICDVPAFGAYGSYAPIWAAYYPPDFAYYVLVPPNYLLVYNTSTKANKVVYLKINDTDNLGPLCVSGATGALYTMNIVCGLPIFYCAFHYVRINTETGALQQVSEFYNNTKPPTQCIVDDTNGLIFTSTLDDELPFGFFVDLFVTTLQPGNNGSTVRIYDNIGPAFTVYTSPLKDGLYYFYTYTVVEFGTTLYTFTLNSNISTTLTRLKYFPLMNTPYVFINNDSKELYTVVEKYTLATIDLTTLSKTSKLIKTPSEPLYTDSLPSTLVWFDNTQN